MGKNARKERRDGQHGPGSWKRKSGPKAQSPGKSMSPANKRSRDALDNASYHHQHNAEWYPKGLNPKTATKGLNAHVLRKLSLQASPSKPIERNRHSH